MKTKDIFQVIENMQPKEEWPWGFFCEDGTVYDKPPENKTMRCKRVHPEKLKKLLNNQPTK
jgi:hypothetical protein